MSTLPKSIQASQAANDDRQSTSSALDARRQALREFVDKYKKLPDDFLRIPASSYPDNRVQDDLALDFAAQQALGITATSTNTNVASGTLIDMVDISVVEAQLVKNYGLLRMDLYCKIRVGHMVCETQTCPNGAKFPKWDGVYQFSLKPGIDSFHLEIYDEKQFSLDEKIAWLHEPIPPEIFRGITVERWFPLSGRSGPQKEGSVLLVISHKRVPMRASNFGRSMVSQHHHQNLTHNSGTLFFNGPTHQHQIIGGTPSIVPVETTIPVPYVQQIPPPAPIMQQHPSTIPDQVAHRQVSDNNTTSQREPVIQVRAANEEDINQLSEMFPSIDKQIIKTILENNNHDKEASIGALLAMG